MPLRFMRSKRSAFTLVELLVVIAIIGLLMALLMSAVQAAREAGRRTVCRSNMRQIGLALHAYHDVRQRLPEGWRGYSSGHQPDAAGTPGWGWATALLPFMEQTALHFQVDPNLSLLDASHAPVRTARLDAFLCPSDVSNNPWFDLDAESGGPLTTLARSNYVGVFGTSDLHGCEHAAPGQQCVSDGVFFHNSQVTFGSVTDGLSTTCLVGERSSKFGFSTWVGVAAGGEEAFARILGIADHQPNHPTGHFDDFGSMHPLGTHFTFGDASVHLIPASIDLDVYRALVTRNGGEPAGRID
jgi:prepilin-type N-terminal cleavage/methylation domain-containing protein